jgi:hypothetical protein
MGSTSQRAKAPLKDATAVNATRWELYRRLRATGLPVECGSGGRTKFNRATRGLPKTHWLDAACVGASTPEVLDVEGLRPLLVQACGHGTRQRQKLDKFGSPRGNPAQRNKHAYGFRTGDIVRADIPHGKHSGIHTGRIQIRNRPSFLLGKADVHPKYLTIIHDADGYAYSLGETIVIRAEPGPDLLPPTAKAGFVFSGVGAPRPRPRRWAWIRSARGLTGLPQAPGRRGHPSGADRRDRRRRRDHASDSSTPRSAAPRSSASPLPSCSRTTPSA